MFTMIHHVVTNYVYGGPYHFHPIDWCHYHPPQHSWVWGRVNG